MLKGKNAVVTGSTSGIGLGIAEALAAAGCNVAINSYSDSEENHVLADKVAESHGVTARFIAADMSDGPACVRLVEDAAKAFGSVDILVNNAGIQYVAPIEEFPPEKWDAIIAINLTSSFHTIRAAVPAMKEAGWGRIVNIASAHGLRASPFKSAYVSAKHGLLGLTKTVALELARNGVTCNAICPGYVMTPMVEKQIPEQMAVHKMDREEVIREVLLERQPTKDFATIEEISGTALFLCSPAANQITGAAISVDGGWTAM